MPDTVSHSDPEAFVEAVLSVVDDIPAGRVMSYGQVAATLGSRSARGVGRIMALHGSDVAWWRVVQASGFPPAGHEARAREHYAAEGTPLVDSARDPGFRVARSAFVGHEDR
jgi:alkylated DNA nucleotide flippase Atl1